MTTPQPLPKTILFICTGNTCRSPMAEAIGRSLVEQHFKADSRPKIFSAGTSAAPAMPATPEAIHAVEALGLNMPAHSSTPLSRAMIEGAGAIYAMTMSHVHAAQAICPEASSRIELLDPDGLEIPDPLGYPQAVYDEAAQTIKKAIERRLSQLATGANP